jgi:serine/threonine protein kinase
VYVRGASVARPSFPFATPTKNTSDIKTANLFLTAAGDVHLGDFGLATRRNGGGGGGASGGDDDGEGGGGGALPGGAEDGSLVGTPHNMSPELLAQRGYGFASDVWSLGCAFYELTAGRPAFNAFNLQGLVSKIRRGRAPPLPAGYSADWTEAVMLCVALVLGLFWKRVEQGRKGALGTWLHTPRQHICSNRRAPRPPQKTTTQHAPQGPRAPADRAAVAVAGAPARRC